MKEMFSSPDLGATLFFFGCVAYLFHAYRTEQPPRLLTWIIALAILVTEVGNYHHRLIPHAFAYALYLVTTITVLFIFVRSIAQTIHLQSNGVVLHDTSWGFVSYLLAMVALVLSAATRGESVHWLLLLCTIIIAWPLHDIFTNASEESSSAWGLWSCSALSTASVCWTKSDESERIFFALLVFGTLATMLIVTVAHARARKKKQLVKQ